MTMQPNVDPSGRRTSALNIEPVFEVGGVIAGIIVANHLDRQMRRNEETSDEFTFPDIEDVINAQAKSQAIMFVGAVVGYKVGVSLA